MKRILFLAVLALAMTSTARAGEEPWRAKMRDVSRAMADAIPYLYSATDQDGKALTEKIRLLSEAVGRLDVRNDHMTKVGDFDPALPELSGSFKEDVDRAYAALQEGHGEYARYVLKGAMSYCIACHTRAGGQGAQLPFLKSVFDQQKAVPWVTRLEFMAASRQFDAASAEVLKALGNGKRQPLSFFDLERGTRLGLAIAVRVKEDAQKVIQLSDAVIASKDASPAMKEAAQKWKRDALEWQKEKSVRAKNTSESAAKMLERAKALVARADAAGGRDDSEVVYLRATAVLQELLRKYPKAPEFPEALYLSGAAYSPKLELGPGNVQSRYFRACVLEVPNTELAAKCFAKYQESLRAALGLSETGVLPSAAQREMDELKVKAQKNKEAK